MNKLSYLCLAITSSCLSSHAFASDFSLPFVNTSGLGVAYADWATAASDASTSFTNPAGLVNLPKQQLVVNALGIFGDAKFTGSSLTPTFPFPMPVAQTGTAKTPIGAFLPSFYYSKALSDRFTLGLGVTAPFGLGTDYGTKSIVRYAATKSQVTGIDIGPSLGFKLSDVASFGAGLDAVRLAFTMNTMYGPPLSFPSDSELQNNLSGWGLGWHAGMLFNVTPKTRAGFSYNSMVTIQTTGSSSVFPPTGNEITTHSQKTNAALPARAQLSFQHDITERWTGMATAFYTNWKTFNQITMQNTMTPFGTTVPVIVPFNYHNCFDYAVGTSFKATEQWLLRAGLQFMNTPSNNQNRGVADPIGSATIVTVGAHFKQNEKLGYDIGVGHSFFNQMPINYANALTSLSGHTNTQTTVIGGQVTWNIG